MPDEERRGDHCAAHGAPRAAPSAGSDSRELTRAVLPPRRQRVERDRGEHDDSRLGADAEAREAVGDDGDEDHERHRRQQHRPRAVATRAARRRRRSRAARARSTCDARLLDAQVAALEERLLARLLARAVELERAAEPRRLDHGQAPGVVARVVQPPVAQARRPRAPRWRGPAAGRQRKSHCADQRPRGRCCRSWRPPAARRRWSR